MDEEGSACFDSRLQDEGGSSLRHDVQDMGHPDKEEDQACGWFRLERPTELSSRQREWHLRSGGSRPQHHRSDPVSDGPGQCPGCACCSEPSRVANLALLLGRELRRRSVPPATGLASKHLTFFRKLLSGSGWNAKILASSSTPPPPQGLEGPEGPHTRPWLLWGSTNPPRSARLCAMPSDGMLR